MRNTSTAGDRARTFLSRLRLLTVVCFAVCLIGGGSISAAKSCELTATTSALGTVDPWGIVIYDHPNFTGWSITYRMNPGMRQKLVPQISPGWEDKVVSIEIGSQVGVTLFAGREFYAGSHSDSAGFGESVARVNVDFKVGSLIVFPKSANGPLGVWLMDKRASGAICCGDTDNIREMTFFPLPESESLLEQGWPFLGQFNLDRNANQIGFDTRYVEVTLYEGRDFQGAFLTLPRAGYPHPQDVYWNFGGMGWSDRAASLKIKWTGGPVSLGPKFPPSGKAFDVLYYSDLPGGNYKNFFLDGIAEDCQDACAADPKCKAFTWVKPGVQGAKAVCWLKSTASYSVKNQNCLSGYVKGLVVTTPKVNAPATFITQYGIDRPGGDYKNFNVAGDASLCEKACAADTKCKAYTWLKIDSINIAGVCWLKSVVTKPVFNAECVSGYSGNVQPEYQKPQVQATTFIAANKNPSTEGEAVIFTATVTSNTGKPSGTVTFKDGNTTLATSPLDASGKTTLSTTALSVGEHSITAVYGGNTDFTGSTSGVLTQTVNPTGAASSAADIAGTWHSSVGIDYVITQSGSQFTWFLPIINETGKGTLNGQDLSVSWSGPATNGSAIGKVTQVDAAGKATRIDWSNGAFFTRQAPQVPSVVDISGTWHGSVGVDYVITQTGSQFTWVLGLINETGKGTLTGQNLSVNWSGPMSNGSATGKITKVDASGKATRIDWSNGAFFYR